MLWSDIDFSSSRIDDGVPPVSATLDLDDDDDDDDDGGVRILRRKDDILTRDDDDDDDDDEDDVDNNDDCEECEDSLLLPLVAVDPHIDAVDDVVGGGTADAAPMGFASEAASTKK
jgi:hypothetical protein